MQTIISLLFLTVRFSKDREWPGLVYWRCTHRGKSGPKCAAMVRQSKRADIDHLKEYQQSDFSLHEERKQTNLTATIPINRLLSRQQFTAIVKRHALPTFTEMRGRSWRRFFENISIKMEIILPSRHTREEY